TDPSPNFEVPNNFDGAGYLFWDERHPTTSMHELIADQVFTLLNEQATPPEMNNVAQDYGGRQFVFHRGVNLVNRYRFSTFLRKLRGISIPAAIPMGVSCLSHRPTSLLERNHKAIEFASPNDFM
ncbi:MAG: hypothetical protein WBV21_14260, partial [Desulfobacterales bacterium]